jgi:hypothetical protein
VKQKTVSDPKNDKNQITESGSSFACIKRVSEDSAGGRLIADRQYAAAHEALHRAFEIQPDLMYALPLFAVFPYRY